MILKDWIFWIGRISYHEKINRLKMEIRELNGTIHKRNHTASKLFDLLHKKQKRIQALRKLSLKEIGTLLYIAVLKKDIENTVNKSHDVQKNNFKLLMANDRLLAALRPFAEMTERMPGNAVTATMMFQDDGRNKKLPEFQIMIQISLAIFAQAAKTYEQHRKDRDD